jgi:hypothetical protein
MSEMILIILRLQSIASLLYINVNQFLRTVSVILIAKLLKNFTGLSATFICSIVDRALGCSDGSHLNDYVRPTNQMNVLSFGRLAFLCVTDRLNVLL